VTGPLLALVGPTACGKTEAGIAVAEDLGAEVVSVDSMLVYRRMDVGTAKPTPSQRARVPHHLVDVAGPGQAFSVARFQALARGAVADIEGRGHRALLVGGSGLYFRAVVDGLEFPGTDPEVRRDLETEAVAVGGRPLYERLRSMDPDAAVKIEPSNVRRTVRALEVAAVTGRAFSTYARRWEEFPAERVRAAGIEMAPAVLRDRIERRVENMVASGFLDEVRELVADGLGQSLTAGQAIGYAEMVDHLGGRISLDQAVASTVRRTRALARRQMAWFRRDPRIRWFRAGPEGAMGIVEELQEYFRGA
jgi:tRNA dimethylallyltransferase